MRELNIGIIGFSSIAKKAIIPALKEIDYFNLKLIGTRNKKSELNTDYPNVIFCSYDEVIASEEIDCVYVSLPVSLHFEWAKKVIESGKHLLLEKTFTDSLDKAKELIALAEDRKVICMEALMYIYHPLFKKVMELLDNKVIGEIRTIEASFGFPYLTFSDIRNSPDLGGGAILDALIYPLSLSLKVAKKDNIKMKSELFVKTDAFDVDTRGFLLLNIGGITAYISYGFGFYYRNEYFIWGTEGYIKVNRGFSRPSDLSNSIFVKTKNLEQEINVEPANHFIGMLDAFKNKIHGIDQSGTNEKEDILLRMEIISKLYEEAKGMV
ncbi:Gfo/Idh/MocA family protein [Paenibacillus hodogayensis]|uniref:Gfo/Idh/MocA family protein n=1 Tax=Paenibacillus hodogayensis TaxID=279208 RepID=A0ABV5VRY5_9BACL